MKRIFSFIRRVFGAIPKNKSLTIGFCLTFSVFFLGLVGPYMTIPEQLRVMYYPKDLPPSSEHLLGTDSAGRDQLAVLYHAIGRSLNIGIVAGIVGVLLGTVIGIIAGYSGGFLDEVLRTVTDLFLVMPTLVILVLVSSYVEVFTVSAMALILAAFAWPGTARRLRAQVLSLKTREYLKIARISGKGSLEIIFKEIMPNLFPYIGISLAGSMSSAMLAEIGLGLIGIGPREYTTLGLMLNWAMANYAMTRKIWWWLAPPIVSVVSIFIGLQLINIGLDEIYNPRLKGVTGR